MISQEKIDRINELARKARAEGLSEAETAERDALRREYIDAMKSSLTAQLENTVIVGPDGTRRYLDKRNN